MMDNASNNDTLMEALESWCQGAGIEFSATAVHMWCMPHTIHLAAIKVCPGLILAWYLIDLQFSCLRG